MPTPAKTSPAAIVAAAGDIIRTRGIEALTMQAVADRVGVRGPSLYKHFADRAAILCAVELSVLADFEAALRAHAVSADPEEALYEMAKSYRLFALSSAAKYSLLFGLQSTDEECRAARRRALQPALVLLEAWLGDPAAAQTRARALTAFLHGFVSMEASGAFQMGGDIEDAFEAGLKLLLRRSKKDRKHAGQAA